MITISRSPDSLSFAAVETNASAAPARKLQSTTNNLAGLVQPTQAQQVQQLYRRGNAVPQIAYNLNLSAQAVDRYLNICAPG